MGRPFTDLFTPSSLEETVASLSFGLISWIQTVFLQVSLAALIFSGPLQDFAAQGIGLLLFGTLIITLVLGLRSSCKTTIAYVQEAPVAMVAVGVAALSQEISSPERLTATAVALIVVSSFITGACLWLLGRFRLGRLVRFIPYPVAGGFLAGTGYFFLSGGIGIMTPVQGLALLQPETLVRWLPGLAFGAILLVLLQRYRHFLLMPTLLLGSVALFYGTFALVNGSVANAAADGWLLGPFPSGSLWQPAAGLALIQADWQVIGQHAMTVVAIILISVISLLLNASGLEINIRREIDFNHELRAAGIANLLAGSSGSPVGFHSLGLSSLGHRLGVSNRLGGVVVAALLVLTLMAGADILSFIPRIMAGGFLTFLGFSFIQESLYKTWFQLPRLDYLLIWIILIAIVSRGLLAGVTLGIAIAALLFLISYSRIDIVRHATDRGHYSSRVERPPVYELLLEQRGEQLAILSLQGYIFFGTAYQLLQQIGTRLDHPNRPPLRFLVLDFQLVTGLDSSAIFSFERLQQRTAARGTQLVITGLSQPLQQQLVDQILPPDHAWQLLPTLEEGITWCEDRLLTAFAEVGLSGQPRSTLTRLREELSQDSAAVDWLDYLNPTRGPAAPPAFEQLMDYANVVEFEPGATLLTPEAEGLYLLEQGSVTWVEAQGPAPVTGRVEAGTVLGLLSFYTEQPLGQTVTAVTAGRLYRFEKAALEQLADREPQVAIALHRVLAVQVGEQARRAEERTQLIQD